MNLKKSLLFIFFAVPGALMFVFSSVLVVGKVLDSRLPASYLTLLLISFAGAFLTLIGLEKMYQWKYIFVFSSIPLSIFLAEIATKLIVSILGHPVFIYPVFILTVLLLPYYVNRLVRKHYETNEDR